MSNICSIHRGYDANCILCNTPIEQFFAEQGIDYERMHAEAEAAGLCVCERCKFEYYRTVDLCPLCGARRKDFAA